MFDVYKKKSFWDAGLLYAFLLPVFFIFSIILFSPIVHLIEMKLLHFNDFLAWPLSLALLNAVAAFYIIYKKRIYVPWHILMGLITSILIGILSFLTIYGLALIFVAWLTMLEPGNERQD